MTNGAMKLPDEAQHHLNRARRHYLKAVKWWKLSFRLRCWGLPNALANRQHDRYLVEIEKAEEVIRVFEEAWGVSR